MQASAGGAAVRESKQEYVCICVVCAYMHACVNFFFEESKLLFHIHNVVCLQKNSKSQESTTSKNQLLDGVSIQKELSLPS